MLYSHDCATMGKSHISYDDFPRVRGCAELRRSTYPPRTNHRPQPCPVPQSFASTAPTTAAHPSPKRTSNSSASGSPTRTPPGPGSSKTSPQPGSSSPPISPANTRPSSPPAENLSSGPTNRAPTCPSMPSPPAAPSSRPRNAPSWRESAIGNCGASDPVTS